MIAPLRIFFFVIDPMLTLLGNEVVLAITLTFITDIKTVIYLAQPCFLDTRASSTFLKNYGITRTIQQFFRLKNTIDLG